MPGDSPAGNRRLSGARAQDGKIADACVKENRRPVERTAGRWHGVGQEISRQEPERHADSQGTHRCHRKLPPPWSGQRVDSMARGRNLHRQEPDSPEQHIFTGHTPETKKNRRPENRRRFCCGRLRR